ncbi:anti-sigma factor [Acidicapsa acidisoli]|uniref:anti-sigma factor n=1 Tax=Acidicapsa acidisoli TaxID=1615681 RepID=UPI0021DFABBD|nr:hypothetical protein [Acidicapsa acidisoli]
MQKTEERGDHERFKELCALAQADALSFVEQRELASHLQTCSSCREICAQFRLIGTEGMRFLSGDHAPSEEAMQWDSSRVRRRLFEAIQEEASSVVDIRRASPVAEAQRTLWPGISRPLWAALAACLMVAVALGAYRAGEWKGAMDRNASNGSALPAVVLSPPMHNPTNLLASQTAQVSALEQLLSAQRREVDRLDAALNLSEQRAVELTNLGDKKDSDLHQLIEERDKLAVQLAASQDANKTIQASVASLRTDHDEAVARAASLEEKVSDLTIAARDQGRRLKDDEQYLSSDRDIRELMGARKLYIADVFDVDSVSRTRKPFGRVFYTQNKSLVFYAFDLDHQPGVKNASTFQVWGQKDSELNAESHPMNLGVLYEDSESNRRWVLRTDDSKQLAEIDAVFVTVEPHGGSEKPTGKPFLYALLRKEANHP